jgi:hypothetical protein
MQRYLAILLGLVLVTVPAASADHDRLEDPGDTETARFVKGSLDGSDPDRNPTTGETDANPEYCSGTYETNPVHRGVRVPLLISGDYCTDLDDEQIGTHQLTVQDTNGNPVGFWWDVSTDGNDRCAAGTYESDGLATFTTTEDCVELPSWVDQDVPAGTVTLERLSETAGSSG